MLVAPLPSFPASLRTRRLMAGTGQLAYSFRIGEVDMAAELIEAHHYSGRMSANVQCVGTWDESGGLFGDYGDCVAACVFSIPPTRWSQPVLELTRLCRAPNVTRSLSGLIAATCGWIRRQRLADCLVSFADRTQGHHGGIYQAASWVYGGCRDRCMDGVMINGAFVPGRSCNSIHGTRSPSKLRQLYPSWLIEPHYDEGKHLYWLAPSVRGKAIARDLGLKSLPYPKPLADRPQDEQRPPLSEAGVTPAIRSNFLAGVA